MSHTLYTTSTNRPRQSSSTHAPIFAFLRLIICQKMNKQACSFTPTLMSGFFLLCCFVLCVNTSEYLVDRQEVTAVDGGVTAAVAPPANSLTNIVENQYSPGRQKRSFFLKKKILGAGLLGFGLGVAKGYKAGYQHQSGPEVHHVYLAAPPPPPVKYVEYVEKPVYIERIVERPVFKHGPVEHESSWSPVDSNQPSSVYGYD